MAKKGIDKDEWKKYDRFDKEEEDSPNEYELDIDKKLEEVVEFPSDYDEDVAELDIDLDKIDKELEKDWKGMDVKRPKLQSVDHSLMRDKYSVMNRGKELWKRANNIHSKGAGDRIVDPITSIEEVDKVLALPYIRLSRENQLVRMWGCHNCFYRGTMECPHKLKDGEIAEHGSCDYRIRGELVKLKAIGSSNGKKFLRDTNNLRLLDMIEHYVAKLNRLRESDKVTKKEMYLLKNLRALQKEFGDRIDNAIKQEDGIKHVNEKKLSPSDLNSLLRKANEKLVEAELVDEEETDETQ